MKMLYLFLILILLALSEKSFSSTLLCWNLWSKKGALETLRAKIENNNRLSNISILQNTDFGLNFNTEGSSSTANGAEITSRRSPYFGLQEFVLAKGIRLILPIYLNNSALSKTSFQAGNLPARLKIYQNGVLEISGSRFPTNQGGNTYIRMNCSSGF